MGIEKYKLAMTSPEVDAALQRAASGGALDQAIEQKAPAGFGLGAAAKFLTPDDDLNGIGAAGWYWWGEPPKNAPYGSYCTMRVDSGAYTVGDYATQTVYPISAASGCSITRCNLNSVWKTWEWVNPPMQLGVEYRTTERYLGKPVYVKVVDLGAGPAASTRKDVVHGIANMAHIVDYGVEMTVNSGQALSLPYHASDANQGWAYVDYTKFSIVANTTALTGYTNCYGWVKYTKTTD